MQKLVILMVALASSLAFASPNPNDPHRGCTLHYVGLAILNPFKIYEYRRTVKLLDDVNGSEDADGTQLHRMIKKVRKECFGAGLDDVRDTITAADDHYVFCQRTGKGYDMFNRKRIAAYVINELQRARPELCK